MSSDVDLLLVVQESRAPFWQRSLDWDTAGLPVPADVLVYTDNEWREMAERGERFYQIVQKEAIWVFER